MAPETRPELHRLQQAAVDALERAGATSAARIVWTPSAPDELSDAACIAADAITAVAEVCARQGICLRAVHDSISALALLRMELVNETREDDRRIA